MSNSLPAITINLSDPEDVRARLPEAQRVASELRGQAQELLEQAETWDRVVTALEAFALASCGRQVDEAEWDVHSVDVTVLTDVAGLLTLPQLGDTGSDESEHEIWSSADEDEGIVRWPAFDGLFVGH